MALAIDGTPVTGTSGTNTLASAAFTNSNTNALIVAVISAASGSAAGVTVSSISGGGLTWTNRQTLSGTTLNYGFAAGDGSLLSVWTAQATSALSAQVVTATLTNNTDGNITIFAVSGADTTTPFDVNASLPKTLTSATHAQATPTVSGVSTTNANTMLLAIVGGYLGNGGASFPITDPTGFTALNNINSSPTFAGQQIAYKVVSAAQSGVTVAYGSQYTDFYYIVDAIQQVSAGGPAFIAGRPTIITNAVKRAAYW